MKDKKIEGKQEELIKKIFELTNSIEEEFDLIEVIEDNIKDIFDCNLDCSECSIVELGKCMQNFKKANLYWIRKSVQDRERMHNIVEKLNESFDILKEYAQTFKNIKEIKEEEDFDKKEEVKAVKDYSIYV